jgi:hypothetical protein
MLFGVTIPAIVNRTFRVPGAVVMTVVLCMDANFCGIGDLDITVASDKTTAELGNPGDGRPTRRPSSACSAHTPAPALRWPQKS